MKNRPMLVCSILGIILLPWHIILPEKELPHDPSDPQGEHTSLLVEYRNQMIAAGTPDPRDFADIIRQDLIPMVDKNPQILRKYPDFKDVYDSYKWADRERSYYIKLLQSIYGDYGKNILKSNFWFVPIFLALIYALVYAIGSFDKKRQ